MKVIVYASILSAFSVLCSTVDVRGFGNFKCPTGTAYVKCSNIPANTCCIVLTTEPNPHGAVSGVVAYKPNSAVLRGYQQTRDGNKCGAVLSTSGTGGSQACINAPGGAEYSGLAWFQNGRKRAEETCTSSVKTDAIVLADGHQFNLTKMDDKYVEELWDLANKHTMVADLPAKFHKFETDRLGVAERAAEIAG